MKEIVDGGRCVALRELSEAKFDLDLLGIVTGARRTGKTMAIRELLHRWRHRFVGGTLFCESAALNGDYDGIFPPHEMHATVTEATLRSIIRRQDEKRKELGPGKHMWMILFDDMSYSDILHTSASMRLLVRNGRHRDICCLISAQDIIDVPTSIRSQAELLICTHTIDRRNLDIMHKVWGGLTDPRQFRTMLFQTCAEVVEEDEPGAAKNKAEPDDRVDVHKQQPDGKLLKHIDSFCVNRQCRSQNPLDMFFYLHCTVGRRSKFGCTDFFPAEGQEAAAAAAAEADSAPAALQPRLACLDVVKMKSVHSWDAPTTHLCPVCLRICTAAGDASSTPAGIPSAGSGRAARKRKRSHSRRSHSRSRTKSPAVPAPAAAVASVPKVHWALTRSTREAVRSRRP